MNISGNNFLSILDSENLSVSCDLDFSNSTGSFDFVLLGSGGNNISFSFESGKIFDSSGRFVYCYNHNNRLSFSGNFSENYDYYFDGGLISNLGYQGYNEITGLEFNSSNCTVGIENLLIKSKKPTISVSLPSSFDESGILTGTITNSTPEIGFKIYSGFLSVGSDYFSLSSIDNESVSEDFNFYLQNIKYSSDAYDVSINFSTNYGEIISDFTLTGEALTNITESIAVDLSETEYLDSLGDSKKQLNIYGTFDKYSGTNYELISKSLQFDIYLSSGVSKTPFSGYWSVQTGIEEFSVDTEVSSYNSTGYSAIINLDSEEPSFYISVVNTASGEDLGFRTADWFITTENNVLSGIFTGVSGG